MTREEAREWFLKHYLFGPQYTELRGAFDIAREALRNPWISVEEEMPKEGEIVLSPDFGRVVYQSGNWYPVDSEHAYPIHDNITHWMSIPPFIENKEN